MEHDIPFGNSNRDNGTTFLDFPLFLGISQWHEPTKRVPFTAEPEIPEILTKWKAPKITSIFGMLVARRLSPKRYANFAKSVVDHLEHLAQYHLMWNPKNIKMDQTFFQREKK